MSKPQATATAPVIESVVEGPSGLPSVAVVHGVAGPASIESSHASYLGTTQWVKTVYGPMVDLLTNTQMGTDPKRVEVNQFIVNQLDGGKMVIFKE